MAELKKSRHISLLLVCLLIFSTHAATSETSAEPAVRFAPEIRSINPDSAPAGRTVVIKGRDFSSDESANTVLFGTIAVEVRKAKRKKLVVFIPASLQVGNYAVTVTVAGQVSNSLQFSVVPAISPAQGQYVGQTSQGHRLSFEVGLDRTIVTRLRTTFNCASNVCAVVLPVSIDRLMEVQANRFGTVISTAEFSAEIEGEFLSETEAEGTASFSIAGACSCASGTVNWSVRLR